MGSGEAFRYAIKPVADIIFEALQDQVIDFYAPGFLLSRGTSQARDEVKAAQAATTLYKEGVAKLNEARINAGLPDLGDAGDVFKGEHNGELVDSDQNKEIGDDEVFRADSDN